MLKNKLLILGTMSTMLVTNTFGSGVQKCAGGACFVNLEKTRSLESFKKKSERLLIIEQPRFIQNTMDKTIVIILDGEKLSVFPSYVMTEEEKVSFYKEQKAIALNEELNKKDRKETLVIAQEVEHVEDKILEKTKLPTSEYFCEKNTKPLYDKALDSFQCV